MRRATHGQRGQTLPESVVFIPLLVVLMFSLLFMGRLGVLSERAQTAVRYGDTVSFKNGTAYSVATVESVIDELLHVNANELGPLCLEPGVQPSPTMTVPPTAAPPFAPPIGASAAPVPTPLATTTSIANRVAADTQAALLQQQAIPSAMPGVPTAKPYWRPDGIAVPGCNPASIGLASGTYGLGNMPASVQTVKIAATLNVPGYIKPFITNGATSAEMGFVNLATPNVLLGCVPGLDVALTILAPATAGKSGPSCPALPVP